VKPQRKLERQSQVSTHVTSATDVHAAGRKKLALQAEQLGDELVHDFRDAAAAAAAAAKDAGLAAAQLPPRGALRTLMTEQALQFHSGPTGFAH
jgi:hypothetical protein